MAASTSAEADQLFGDGGGVSSSSSASSIRASGVSTSGSMLGSAGSDAAASPFPGFGNGPGRRVRSADEVGLRASWIRPPPHKDRLYDQDDFASEEDRVAGLRRFAPAAPTAENRGALLAEARRRYEREWAMELENVDKVRQRATDTDAMRASRIAGLAAVSRGEQKGPAPRRGGPLQRKLIDRTGAAAGYITTDGNKPLPKGIGLYRILGRPPPRVLKQKNTPDTSRILGLKTRRGRKRNLGAGLGYDEAKQKWMTWYQRNKTFKFETVMEAASPKREDVEAEYDERQRRRGRGRGRSSQSFGQGSPGSGDADDRE